MPLIYDLPEAEYHAGKSLDTISKSGLDLIARSPAHYRAAADSPRKPTPDMVIGSRAHLAILQYPLFEATHYIEPEEPDFGDCRYKAAKDARDVWRSKQALAREEAGASSKTAITDAEARQVIAMHTAVLTHPVAGRLLRGGHPEVSVLWTDPATGLAGRSRLDYYRPDLHAIIDLKTTHDASPKSFAKSVADYRYHVQEALYRMAMAAEGVEIEHFVFVAVEKVAPFGVAVYTLDNEARQIGMRLATRDIATLAECVRAGEWPGYSDHIAELSLPRWAAKE